MIHYGDICSLNGKEMPPVNLIIGGSPCQNLSISGNRQGLQGDESRLFYEQIRIIEEMRSEYVKSNSEKGINIEREFIMPRFMLWENVPGCLSSNSGKDFQIVLDCTVRITKKQAPSIPIPKRGWPKAGCLMGDGFSIAWRIQDAQWYGTPQRRRRVALVADFGGQCAPEILFEPKSMSRSS